MRTTVTAQTAKPRRMFGTTYDVRADGTLIGQIGKNKHGMWIGTLNTDHPSEAYNPFADRPEGQPFVTPSRRKAEVVENLVLAFEAETQAQARALQAMYMEVAV